MLNVTKIYDIALLSMMPMAQKGAETCNRRAAVWGLLLHSKVMVVPAKNLDLYPDYSLYSC